MSSSSIDGSSSTRRSQAKLNEIGIGKKYQSKYGTNGSDTPWLNEDNVEVQRRIHDNCWKRSWDGKEGTAHEHAQWVLEQARSLTSAERAHEFRPYGNKNGNQFYIHDAMTIEAGGYGMFKIEATLDVSPQDVLAVVFDMEALASADPTVVLCKVIATYRGTKLGDPFQAVAYWCNNPGFPFAYRDGIDLTTYHRDMEEDGSSTYWQLSTSLHGTDQGDHKDSSCFKSQGIPATDRLFAYKLVPSKNDNGSTTTHVTLLSQTVLNGYIPKFLSNRMICTVLMDYMKTIEIQVKRRKESGEHDAMLKQLELT
jgi:hypothetical protein